jgi:Secretion system C-terminal sorting domain
MKKITILFTMLSLCYGYSQTTVEAETGKLYKGAVIQDCGACSQVKQVGDLGGPSTESGYFVSTVNVAKAGTYKMNLSFSSGETRSIFISVNGFAPLEVALNSGDWGVVGLREVELQLFEGTNSIKFYNHTGYGPNIDKFVLTLFQEASPCVSCFGPFEAENGVIFAPATIQDCETCSNGKQVGDMGYSDRYFTQNVLITTPGTYRAYISYSSGADRSISLTANETTTVSGMCNSVDWGVVFVKTLDINLAAGNNTLKFHTPGDWSPNIDKFRLALVSGLGVEDKKINTSTIYPNPTKNSWNIKTQSAAISEISIFDMLGKKVMSLQPNSNETLIDGSNLEKGLYLSQITTETGVETFKLIKE